MNPKLGAGQSGDAAVLVLATGFTLLVAGLMLATVDYLGALAVREQVQAGLVTSVRGAARQLDREEWVYHQRLTLQGAEPAFRHLIAANLGLNAAGYPTDPRSAITGPVEADLETSSGSAGMPQVTGRVVVPVRTPFFGRQVVLRLSYTADVETVMGLP